MRNLAEQWVEKNVRLEGLIQEVVSRFESGGYGYNEDKTERGMFVEEVINDTYTRWTNVYLANHYGLISDEERDKLIEEDKHDVDFKQQFDEIEKEILSIINAGIKGRLRGEFVFAWTEHYENLPIYYGLCYQESV